MKKSRFSEQQIVCPDPAGAKHWLGGTLTNTHIGALVNSLMERRGRAGITQVDLAKRMGSAQSQLSKFERYERRLDVMDYARAP